jgi:hypothetical protein
MNLRYIALRLNKEQFSDDDRYDFKCHTRFISNFFSKSIRKIKFNTDGTFDMICIDVCTKVGKSKIIPLNALSVDIAFNQNRYKKIRGGNDSSYYLELLEEGFRKASELKAIPLNDLLHLIVEFRNNGCKNEWLYKKKKFKEDDIEAILTCEFTTNYFQVVAIINQISTKKELIKGIVLRTEPDEVLYEKMFKDILIVKNKIVIVDASDSPRIVIKKDKAMDGILEFEIIGDKEIRDMLSYGLRL